jgi:hypothetical protein
LIRKSDAFLFNHNLLLVGFVLVALVDIDASIGITHVPSLVLVTLLLLIIIVRILFILLVEYLAIGLILVVLLVHGLVVVVHLGVLLPLIWVVLLVSLLLLPVILIVVVSRSLVVLALISLEGVVDIPVNELLLLLEQLLLFINLFNLGYEQVIQSHLVIFTDD